MPPKPASKPQTRPGTGKNSPKSPAGGGGGDADRKKVATEKKERPPLYEPKYRVQLPPRIKKPKVERWPKIQIPPLKLRPWSHEEAGKLKPPPPKPEIKYPPIKRKPWKPPVDIPPPKPKPKIEYPPLVARSRPQKERKPKPRPKPIRLSQIFYPVPKSTLSKIWNNYRWKGKNYAILSGNFSQASKKYPDSTNNKQSAGNAVACLSYHQCYQPCSKWFCTDIDKILDLGDWIYKTTALRTKRKTFCPGGLYPVLFVGSHKIEVCIGNTTIEDFFDRRDGETIKKVYEYVSGILEKDTRCIFTYNCDLTFSFWLDNGAYFIFVPYDTDNDGNMVQTGRGAACVIRCRKLEYLLKYLMMAFTPSLAKYKIYSFEIVRTELIPTAPELPAKIKPDKIELKALSAKMIEPIQKLPSAESIKIPEVKIDYSFHPETIKRIEPVILSKDYKKIDGSYGILRGTKYMNDSFKAAAMSAAVLVRLTGGNSMKWIMHTVDDILDLGEKIFDMNPIQNDRVAVSDIKEPITFREHSYILRTDNVIFGQLNPIRPSVADLSVALKEFFMKNDTGVIQGPQIVSIWVESGLYFYFDPKERDMVGQKFIGSYDSKHGTACVLWFNDLETLASKYLMNISEKYHRDLFRIVKVEVVPNSHKSENCFNWHAIGLGVWILRASTSEESDTFNKMNRGMQGTCMAVTTIAFTHFSNPVNWTFKQLDEILKFGDEIYTISVVQLKSRGKFVSPLLKIDEVEQKFMLKDKKMAVKIGETMINGSLLASSADVSDLENSLQNFFKFNKSGVLTSCNVSLAIFKKDEAYYFFDPHPRDEEGKNVKAQSVKKVSSGVACALRFSSIPLMACALLSSFLIQDSTEFSIVPVEVIPKLGNVQPDFAYFTPLSMYRYVGILKAKVHEDSDIFWLKSSVKTVCNLLMAMAFNEIIPVIYWKEDDLEEILRLGHELLKKVPGSQDKWTWVLENVKIGSNRYKFLDSPVDCVFEHHELMGEEEELVKTEEFNPFESISPDENVTGPSVPVKTEEDDEGLEEEKPVEEPEDFTEPEAGETGSNKSFYLTPTEDLENQIMKLEELSKVWVIIESDLFEVGIWKQNDYYFLFDPKQTADDGTWPQVRYQTVKSKIWKNNFHKKTEVLRQNQTNAIQEPEIEVHENNLRTFKVPEATFSMFQMNKKQALKNLVTHSPFTCQDGSGGASVMLFTKPDLLLRHLKKIIPNEHLHDTLTWHQLDLKGELEINKVVILPSQECNWYNFSCFKPNQWILRGFTAQTDGNLPFNNSQDHAIGVVALAFAISCSPSSWTSDMIDIALKYGSKLYSKSLSKVQKTNPNLAKTGRLEPENLINSFVINKTLFTTQVETFKLEKLQLTKHSPETKDGAKEKLETVEISAVPSPLNLEKYLIQFFIDHELGILSSRHYGTAIFKSEDYFYIFDSHNVGPDGVQREFGVACLTRFKKIEDLTHVFLSNVEQCQGLNVFKLYGINITPGPFPPASKYNLTLTENDII